MRIYATRTGREIQARCVADSGIAKALCELNAKLKTNPAEIDAALTSKQVESASSLLKIETEAMPAIPQRLAAELALLEDSMKALRKPQEYIVECST